MESEPNKEKLEVIIELAKPDDAKEIENVFYETWLATYPGKVPGVTEEDVHKYYEVGLSSEKIEEYQNRIKESLDSDNRRFFTAKVDGKVVGICIALKSEENNQLKAIYVLPEFQGKRIGYELWTEALGFIDQSKDTTVEVVTQNDNAIEFYEKLGFEDTGKRWTDEKFTMASGATFPEMELRIKGTDSLK
jgi:ribosomal protein S18 acetylase RimI-like enzyme